MAAGPFPDVACLTVGGMNQHVPEVRVLGVQRDGPGHPVRVVIGVCHHQDQRV
jgi:hypothetical protein